MSTRESANSLRTGGEAKYDEFLRRVELISVGLRRCSASLDRPRLIALYAENKAPRRTLADTYKVTDIGENYFEAAGSFVVHLRESNASTPVLTVECEFEAHLHGPEPISEASVKRFVESEFRLILVPYARQFVSSVTATMSIPPLVMPLRTKSLTVPSRSTPERLKRTAKKR